MDICICIIDSFCCAPETTTTFLIRYTTVKINFKKSRTGFGRIINSIKGYFRLFLTYGRKLLQAILSHLYEQTLWERKPTHPHLCQEKKKILKRAWLSEKCKSKPQWGTISCQSEWLWSKSLHAINAGEGVEKREAYYTVSGNAN